MIFSCSVKVYAYVTFRNSFTFLSSSLPSSLFVDWAIGKRRGGRRGGNTFDCFFLCLLLCLLIGRSASGGEGGGGETAPFFKGISTRNQEIKKSRNKEIKKNKSPLCRNLLFGGGFRAVRGRVAPGRPFWGSPGGFRWGGGRGHTVQGLIWHCT